MFINVTMPAGPIAYQYAAYGRGSGPVWLKNLKCTGNEKQLFNCSFMPTIYSYCDHYNDASVRCAGKKYFFC